MVQMDWLICLREMTCCRCSAKKRSLCCIVCCVLFISQLLGFIKIIDMRTTYSTGYLECKVDTSGLIGMKEEGKSSIRNHSVQGRDSSDAANSILEATDGLHSALASGSLKMFLSDGLFFFFLSLTAEAVAYNK